MTAPLTDRGIRLVLLDIEGTTTPIAFVHDVLFPYARLHLDAWCRAFRGSTEYAEVRRRLATEHAADLGAGEGPPPWQTDEADEAGASESPLVAYATWLMDRDRKSPGLKLLQGHVWEQGYQAGELRGQVYPDVPTAIRRWRDTGIGVAIYSSGSELAQRRLFSSTEHGDLTPFIVGFFDTAAGPKHDPASYAGIASAIGHPTRQILFVSDVTSELAAARKAGCETALSLRPGNPVQSDADNFSPISGLGDLP